MKNRSSVESDNWKTPTEFYNKLNEVYKFEFDPCPYNHDLNDFNGLEIEWKKSNFCNPPYSRTLKEAFVLKAIEKQKKGNTTVCLFPVSTSTKLFHNHILPNAKKIEFIKGRIKFEGYNTKNELVKNKTGMFDSMIIIF
jgi:hypothetical protein